MTRLWRLACCRTRCGHLLTVMESHGISTARTQAVTRLQPDSTKQFDRNVRTGTLITSGSPSPAGKEHHQLGLPYGQIRHLIGLLDLPSITL